MRTLTKQQAVAISGREFKKDSHFNIVLDDDMDRVIGEEEVALCDNEFIWVKNLPQKEYKPVKIKKK